MPPLRAGPIAAAAAAAFAAGLAVGAAAAGNEALVRWVEYGSEGFGSSGERVVHVGLGAERSYDAVEIAWPSGIRQRLGAGRAQRMVEVTESVRRAAAPRARLRPRAPRSAPPRR